MSAPIARPMHVVACVAWLAVSACSDDASGAMPDAATGMPPSEPAPPANPSRLPVLPADPPSPPGDPAFDPAPVARTRLAPPTYYADIAPIFAARCVSCHDDGGIAPFSLRDYDTAASRAESIASVVATRMMPPWPADPGACEPIRDARRLTDAELALVVSWANEGAPLGDPADATMVAPPATPTITPTVRVAPSEPYAVMPGEDAMRCYVVDPGLDVDQHMTAYRIDVDRAEVVHHLQLHAIDDPSVARTLRERDAMDAAPGYPCGEELGAESRMLVVWAQGDRIRRLPAGTGLLLGAHRLLVIQVHYHPIDEPVLDSTGVSIELAREVHRVAELRGIAARFEPLAPREPEVEVRFEARIAQDSPLIAYAVRAHAHTLATSARIELVRGASSSSEGDDRCLLDVPRWEFEWQLFYDFARPVVVESTDWMRITCTYDTRSRSTPVLHGTRTEDEMCIGYLYVARLE